MKEERETQLALKDWWVSLALPQQHRPQNFFVSVIAPPPPPPPLFWGEGGGV